MTDSRTVREAVAAATRVLAAAGVASPQTDAALLAAHVLGISRGRLVLAGRLTPEQSERFERLVERRAARVPLQHLTGVVGFRRLELAVGPGGFIPRPETELLAQWAVDMGRAGEVGGGLVIVDLASGTGALALAIAQELRPPQVYAVESSPGALGWLRRNAAARAAAGDPPVEVVAGDATDPAVLAERDGTVDLVVSNPPYVPAGTAVPPEVADHDPPEAVFGGPDGLAVIRPLVARAAALLRPGGWLGMEHDETHAEAVPRLLARWFTDVSVHRDLAERPRYATGRRTEEPYETGTAGEWQTNLS